MEQVTRQFRQIVALTQPWVIVAVILATALFLYFAFQGVRYLQASWDNSAAREEIDRLEATGDLRLTSAEEQEADSQAKQLRLEGLLRLFDYPSADTLISVVSDTAEEAGLGLSALTVEDASVVPRGTLQFRVRPISVILDGPTANVQEFLSALYDRIPVVVASDARMVNLSTKPSTRLQLRFYLSPEPMTEPTKEPAG